MTSRKNINIFYLNGVNVAKHWHVAGDVLPISDCLVIYVTVSVHRAKRTLICKLITFFINSQVFVQNSYSIFIGISSLQSYFNIVDMRDYRDIIEILSVSFAMTRRRSVVWSVECTSINTCESATIVRCFLFKLGENIFRRVSAVFCTFSGIFLKLTRDQTVEDGRSLFSQQLFSNLFPV